MAEDLRPVQRQLRLTRLGLWAERITHAFWPAWTAATLAAAVWTSGLVPDLWEFSLIAALVLAALVLVILGLRGFRAPTAEEARARLDATLPGRPLSTLADRMAVGGSDAGASAVWSAHRARMAARLTGARAVAPDLRVARRDPYALRYMAILLLALAVGFGTLWRAPVLPDLPGVGGQVATGPAWEGWLEPPRHTGLPTLYLNDIEPGEVTAPEGTRVTLRLYGEAGALGVSETVSGRSMTQPSEPLQEFTVAQSGTIAIDGPDDAPVWTLTATPDAPPEIALDGAVAFEHPDVTTLPWRASDDYGVTGADVTIALDPGAPDLEHGLAAAPEPRQPLTLEMSLPIAGDRTGFAETFRGELAKHPLAGLPVEVTLRARDGAGQVGKAVAAMILPARPFYSPVAAALIEQRRDLLWTRENRARAARLLRAITWRADGAWDNPSAYLIVRMAIRRLDRGELTVEARDEIAEMLWQAALRIEENSLDSALERLRQAQDRLSEAIRQGAGPEEIERLMAEMRQAMDDYTRQLAQPGQQGEQGQQQARGEMQEVTPDMLDQMMQRIEELMQQGRTAEAQELLRQLQEMMENMQVAQGQGQGEGGQGQGEQAMDQLREQLREQQDLSDEAFRELQEQFGSNGQPGRQGQGEPGQGQPGQPGGDQQAEEPGANGEQGDAPDARSLAERQRALGEGLETLRDGLPGAGTEAGDAAREALRRAEDAMEDAERDLTQDNLGGALDDQAQAMDALRDGMQELGRAMAGERQEDPGEGRGQGGTRNGQATDRDPLGRRSGEGGQLGTDESFLTGPEAARRAQDLMDEIRRRSGERERPQVELDYLRRLLERF
ncbi:TIGR02302 family protein [uncultured Jannaschia sp.]|uniref:TIGR02302 family protein n=1 Tax=uncultured Jannaschia sp. TaxID=293347 RepID=UPI00262CDCEE|nr:TIGR02302 family protein [uncultured Jannaschia sp.]